MKNLKDTILKGSPVRLAAVKKLLQREKDYHVWFFKLESLGVVFTPAAPDPNHIEVALDLLTVPGEHPGKDGPDPGPDFFSRDWFVCKFWDEVVPGSMSIDDYIIWAVGELEKL